MIAVDPIKAVAAGALVLAIAGAAAVAWRIDSLKDRVAVLEAQAETWRQAQDTNMNTIAVLKAANKRIIDAQRADKAEGERAVAAAAARQKTIEQERDRALGELERVYAKSPQARAWAATGVDADVARRLPGGTDR